MHLLLLNAIKVKIKKLNKNIYKKK
jgi:hypothetical protein